MARLEKIKMLLVIAGHITDDSEPVLIEKLLTQAPLSDRYQLKVLYALDMKAVVDVAKATKPDIIHFYGKCTPQGEFFFRKGADAVVARYQKSEMLHMLVDAIGSIKLVYFNGMINDQDLLLADDKVDFLIGMNKGNDDLASLYFSRAFYVAVGFGNPVGISYARIWHGLPLKHRDIALRFKKLVDPDNYFLISQKTPVN